MRKCIELEVGWNNNNKISMRRTKVLLQWQREMLHKERKGKDAVENKGASE